MTKKDFFRIIIKLFGLYTGVGILYFTLPQVFMSMYYGFKLQMEWTPIIILMGLMFYVMLFKPDSIINLFKLDRGFDDPTVDLGIFKGEAIIQLGLVLISLFLIIDNIPDLITNLFYAFKTSLKNNALNDLMGHFDPYRADYFTLIKSAICLILGFFVLTNCKRLAARIHKINMKNSL